MSCLFKLFAFVNFTPFSFAFVIYKFNLLIKDTICLFIVYFMLTYFLHENLYTGTLFLCEFFLIHYFLIPNLSLKN